MSCLAAFLLLKGVKVPFRYREGACKVALFCGAKEQVSQKWKAAKNRSSLCREFRVVGNLFLYSFKFGVFEGAKEQVLYE